MENIHKIKAKKARDNTLSDQFEAKKAKNKAIRERKFARWEEHLAQGSGERQHESLSCPSGEHYMRLREALAYLKVSFLDALDPYHAYYLDRVAVKKASGKNPAISVHAPPNDKTLPDPDEDESDPAGIVGLRSYIVEIEGRFKSGISNFFFSRIVSEITKMASNLLQLGEEEEEEDSGRGAVGVADEVVAFVRDIAMHPETWLDFPLLDDEDD
ncbi:putative bidirectional sugar transporter SWEET12-like [Capsicum annuum]|nr:putative bidirectional sugar transporter SWEET12-like [Capsicum annuum]